MPLARVVLHRCAFAHCRRYNGVWIAADGDLPFVMDGWVSAGYGIEYNGSLIKGDRIVEAWDGRSAFNAIQR